MSHNTTRQVQSLRFVTAVKLAVVITSVTLVALFFVVQNTQNKDLNEQISENEKQLASLKDEIRIKQMQVAQLRSPENLKRRVAEFNLGLAEIQQSQIVRLYDQAPGSGENAAPESAPVTGTKAVSKTVGRALAQATPVSPREETLNSAEAALAVQR